MMYESLLKEPLKHFGSVSYANSIHTWAFLLLAIILEQEKRLLKLERVEGRKKNELIERGEGLSG